MFEQKTKSSSNNEHQIKLFETWNDQMNAVVIKVKDEDNRIERLNKTNRRSIMILSNRIKNNNFECKSLGVNISAVCIKNIFINITSLEFAYIQALMTVILL